MSVLETLVKQLTPNPFGTLQTLQTTNERTTTMDDNNSTTTDKLNSLIAAFMMQEQCNGELAGHCISRVCQFLGFPDADPLLTLLEGLEAETLTASPVGIRQSRLLRSLYDCAIVGVLPNARRTLLAILETAGHVEIVEATRH